MTKPFPADNANIPGPPLPPFAWKHRETWVSAEVEEGVGVGVFDTALFSVTFSL